MNSSPEETARFWALVDRALEGELTEAEGEALAAWLRRDAARREEFRRELARWEHWAQATAPERSAAAFVASWRKRVEAEADGAAFTRDWRRRAADERTDAPADATRGSWWRRRWLPAWGGIAAAIAVALAGAWLGWPSRAEAVQRLQGEAVCRKCQLGETQAHAHTAAVRWHDAQGAAHLCYLEPDDAIPFAYGNFCARPVPVIVTGVRQQKAGREVVTVRRVEPATPSPDPKRAPRDFTPQP